MAILKTEAVVLDRRDYSNTSLIVTFYTQLFGRLSTIAKGARRIKSPFHGTLDLLNHNEIVFYRHTRSSLHTLSHSEIKNGFPGIRDEVKRTSAGSYIVELVKEMTRDEERQPDIFNLTIEALRELSDGNEITRVLFQFEIQFLQLTGFQPELYTCVSCSKRHTRGRPLFSNEAGGILCHKCASSLSPHDIRRTSSPAVVTLRNLMRNSFRQSRDVEMTAPLSRDIKRLLRPYIISRMEKIPQSMKYV